VKAMAASRGTETQDTAASPHTNAATKAVLTWDEDQLRAECLKNEWLSGRREARKALYPWFMNTCSVHATGRVELEYKNTS
jgi:hypothetical protein